MKKLFNFAYVMNFMSQAGFSLATPICVWLLVGYLLTEKAGLGKWAMAICIVLGVVCGVVSMFKYIIFAVDKSAGDKNPTSKGDKSSSDHRIQRKDDGEK